MDRGDGCRRPHARGRALTRDDIYEEIAALAVQFGETKREKLRPETRLFTDLGLDGDVAAAFMQAFSERFDVDMEGFYWLRYFGDEGWDMLAPVLVVVSRLVSPRFNRGWRAARAEEREITLAHLVDVAEAKHWTHPGLEHRPDQSVGVVAVLLMACGAVPPLIFAGFSAIALYGLVVGEVTESSIFVLAVVIGAASFPLILATASWRNIQRKLASAGSSD